MRNWPGIAGPVWHGAGDRRDHSGSVFTPRTGPSEAASAALAGVSPLQASSGNTKRQRPTRGGDRQLKWALDIIARNRMRFDEKTKAYVERRTAEGLCYREIKRCLKRFLARSVFRQLEALGP